MNLDLNDKVAIVTGGSQGIGRAISMRLAAERCKVVVAARGQASIDATVAEIREAGGEAMGVSFDAFDPHDIIGMVEKTVAKFGTVHVLVNNAGGHNEPYQFDDIEDEHWQRAFEINVLAAVRAARAVLPLMRSQSWGRIINISSVAGLQPEATTPHYNAMKAALNNFTKSFSRLVGKDGILVNAVSPDLVKTPGFVAQLERGAEQRGLTLEDAERRLVNKVRPSIVLGRVADTTEVADLVAFLSSERAGFITGANYRLDGGSVMTP